MPRRVLTVTAADIARHALDTDEGRKHFLRRRQPDDHEQWTATLAESRQHLVLDHVDPTTPLAAVGVHHPGQPLVHRGGFPRVPCAEPGGCPREALHGARHCEIHFRPPGTP